MLLPLAATLRLAVTRWFVVYHLVLGVRSEHVLEEGGMWRGYPDQIMIHLFFLGPEMKSLCNLALHLSWLNAFKRNELIPLLLIIIVLSSILLESMFCLL